MPKQELLRDDHEGQCHCGAVRFRVKLIDRFQGIRRCNCSMCARRGAIMVSCYLKDLEIISGADKLTEYQFGTKSAKHYFCSVCGIYTHHQRRSNPQHYGINVACLDGLDPFDFPEVPVINGAGAHPKDIKPQESRGSLLLETLRFEPNEEGKNFPGF